MTIGDLRGREREREVLALLEPEPGGPWSDGSATSSSSRAPPSSARPMTN
jgi:hypothetical protein